MDQSNETRLLVDLILDVKKDVSEVRKEVSEVKEMTFVNANDLKEHMLRSHMSEARLDVQEEKLEKFIESMEPVKEHVETIHSLTRVGKLSLKVLAVLGTIAGTIASFLKFR